MFFLLVLIIAGSVFFLSIIFFYKNLHRGKKGVTGATEMATKMLKIIHSIKNLVDHPYENITHDTAKC